MKIILQGGPHDGHCDTVSDECQIFHRDLSCYKFTHETDDEGRQIFKYDEKASQRHKRI